MTPPAFDLEPLITAARGGDRDAFGRLVDATSGVVCSISLSILRDLDSSRDVAQDVFLAAWRDRHKLRNPRSFLPWLRQMTRNRAHHVLRSHVRLRRRQTDAVTDGLLESVADPRPDASERMVAGEEAAALAEALSLLPDETREVLTLFYREGQSVAQVAALLELTEGAVKKRLSRARQVLRESLLERVGDTLRSTAPRTGFTAAVLAGLSMAAPATSSAAALAVAKSAVKVGLFGKILLFVASALPGLLGGLAAIRYAARGFERQARDDEERRGLRRYAVMASITVGAFAVGGPLATWLTGNPWWIVGAFLAYVPVLAWLQHVFIPGVIKRRLEAEMSEDPVAATARRNRERRHALIGWTVGLTLGTAGALYGLFLAGLL